MDDVTVRRLSAVDARVWAAVRELCCRTGDDGNPIAPERWLLFARIWIEPYQKLLPAWSYAAETSGSLAGYLTGCPNSSRFRRAERWRVTLPLLGAIALGRYRRVPGVKEFVMHAIGVRRSIDRRFSPGVRRRIERGYPAHLHVNVDEARRRSGIGRRLIETYVSDLRSAGVCGVHLFCGAGPLEFYLRFGFQILERIDVGKTAVYALAKEC